MKKYRVNKIFLLVAIFGIIISINTNINAKEKDESLKVKKKNKTIIVDPGHNYGKGDTGARSQHGDSVYIERDLNMSISVDLKNELEKRGYNVILTRKPWEREDLSVDDSLNRRVEIGNTSNADFFISIHHDANKSKDMNGVSAFYSSWKPMIDEGEEIPGYCCQRYGRYNFTMSLTPTKEAIIGKEVAVCVVNEIASKLDFNNIGAHDRDLRVTKATKIPAILVECGFITNPDEAKKCANWKHQKEVAKIIAEVIGTYI